MLPTFVTCSATYVRKDSEEEKNMDVHKGLVHEKGVIEISEAQRCLFCFKTFTTSSNCKRHQKQCSLKEKQIEKITDGGKDDQCG